jgi:hypothetical protein
MIVLAIGGVVGVFVTQGGSDGPTTTSTGANPGASEVEPGTPEAAVVDWWAAMAERDYAEACDLLTQRSVEQLQMGSPTCEAELERINPNGLYDQGDDTVVLEVLVEDEFARVTVRTGASALPENTVIAVREGGTWKAAPFDTPHKFRDEIDANGYVITRKVDPASPEGQVREACRREEGQVADAISDYYEDGGVEPPDLEALVAKGYLTEMPRHSLVGIDGGVEMVGDCA